MQNDPFCNAKGALLVENGAAATLQTDKTEACCMRCLKIAKKSWQHICIRQIICIFMLTKQTGSLNKF